MRSAICRLLPFGGASLLLALAVNAQATCIQGPGYNTCSGNNGVVEVMVPAPDLQLSSAVSQNDVGAWDYTFILGTAQQSPFNVALSLPVHGDEGITNLRINQIPLGDSHWYLDAFDVSSHAIVAGHRNELAQNLLPAVPLTLQFTSEYAPGVEASATLTFVGVANPSMSGGGIVAYIGATPTAPTLFNVMMPASPKALAAASVPEPATWVSMALGFAVVCLVRARSNDC